MKHNPIAPSKSFYFSINLIGREVMGNEDTERK